MPSLENRCVWSRRGRIDPTPTVLRVQYDPGLNYRLIPPPSRYFAGELPLAADTVTTESVRFPGALNTLIRNGSAVPMQR